MTECSSSTLERIHTAALAEFLEKGYQAASLRGIVKTAGVTTGALYGYYDSKEALFAALPVSAVTYPPKPGQKSASIRGQPQNTP